MTWTFWGDRYWSPVGCWEVGGPDEEFSGTGSIAEKRERSSEGREMEIRGPPK